MRKAILFILALFIIEVACEKRVEISPDILNLPFPTEGSKDIILEKNISHLLNKSWLSLRKGKIQEATYHNRKALNLSPKSPPLWVMEGYINLANANINKAKKNFTISLQLEPNYPTALNALAYINFLQKNYVKAYELYKNLAILYPDFPSAEINLNISTLKVIEYYKYEAEKNISHSKYKEAIEDYKKAIVISPTLWELHYNLSQIYINLKDYKNAIIYLQLANNFNPQSKKIKETLASLLFNTGDYKKALTFYQDLLDMEPANDEWKSKIIECRRLISFLNLPEEFRNAEKANKISRAVLAAYLIYKMPSLSRISPIKASILTDISSHWAKDFIIKIVNLDILEELPNHTFEPSRYVKRSELATCLYKMLKLLKKAKPDLDFLNTAQINNDIRITDISREYINYDAIKTVVNLKLMEIDDKMQFKPENYITGKELVSVIERIAPLFSN